MPVDNLMGPSLCGQPGACGHHIGDPWFLECFFQLNMWFGMVQNKKKLIDARKAEILVKIYWLCRAKNDNHYMITNCLILFQIVQISLLFVLFD